LPFGDRWQRLGYNRDLLVLSGSGIPSLAMRSMGPQEPLDLLERVGGIGEVMDLPPSGRRQPTMYEPLGRHRDQEAVGLGLDPDDAHPGLLRLRTGGTRRAHGRTIR
jgi:hypothetical protein